MSEHEHEHDEPTEPEPTPAPDEDEDEAEAEEAEEAPAEPEPEGMSEAEIESINKKLDVLQKHVASRMSAILGEDATLFEECDLCSFWNTPGWRMSGPLPDELTAALQGLLGAAMLDDLRFDPHSRVCAECDGLGQVRSGSRVASHVTLTCVACQGRGWEATDEKRSGYSPSYVNGSAALEAAPMATDRLAPTPENVPPEVEALRARGYVVVPPALPVG